MRNKGLFKFLMMICFLGATFTSCNKDDDDVKIDYDAVYEFEVTFTGQWYSENVTGEFPEDASFTSFVGLTHNSANALYRLGSKASDGLAEFAKTGTSTTLIEEINAKIAAKRSSVLIQAGELKAEDEISVTFRTNLRHRYVSLVGKIGPSPDWFVSIANFDLTKIPNVNNGNLLMFLVNDAGVKDGTTFTAPGEDTDKVISRVTSGPLTIGGVVPTMGYITIMNRGKVEEE